MSIRQERSLGAMAVLLGEWTMEVPQFPGFRGRATIDWLEDGAYLAVRDRVDAGDFPSGTWIFGADDSMDACTALYYDSRDVRRVYHSTLADGIWTIWRNAPEFNQRFTGALAGDGRTIIGKWEMATDGSEWATDFDLVYRKGG